MARPEFISVLRNPPMTDQVMRMVATDSMTAAIASRGMTLLVRYLRVSRAWYTGRMVGRPGRVISEAARWTTEVTEGTEEHRERS